ncbi:nuclear transport factor 2 family protein [Caulobacter sp. 17J80-11]|uniref:ester cyclase n=1 Tax=Caulobacter sp. 17J80-11 TaxID=2763502 RepID=UPI0016534E64|nr:nuclear transport factor 2 family protein [Caulobacter sp. 17J80-11]
MTTSTPDAAKAVVRAYVEAFNAGDFPRLRGLFTDDAVIWGVLGWGPIDEVVPIWRELHEALALELTVEALAADGDTVAARYTERGVSRAPFRDRPATGRAYELVAMEWFELDGGKIRRRWGARDAASQARQLGW